MKGTVVLTETLRGCGASGLVQFHAVWPSGRTFTKYVDLGDDVNERRRQIRFALDRGYRVEHNGVLVSYK